MLVLSTVFGLLGLAAAQNPSPSSTTETLAQRCVTVSGPSSHAVLETRTRTPALTTRITSNITSTPTITFTPSLEIDTAVVNLTLTNTETQLQSTNVVTITNTQSVTTLFTSTVTSIATFNMTEFESSTTSATILPSSGFVPIQSVIAQAGSLPGKRDEIYARAKRPAAQMVVQDDGTIVTTPRQTIIDPAVTVTASAPRTEITITSTFSANATALQADVTQLITGTAVATISSTTTLEVNTTVTSTVTEVIYSTFPTPYYAACSPSNIARTVDGLAMGRMGVKNSFGTLSANTPYDCCVRGIQGDYAGTFFQKGGCFLISQAVPAVCDPEEQAFTFSTVATLEREDAVVVSNGNCGQGQYLEPAVRPQ